MCRYSIHSANNEEATFTCNSFFRHGCGLYCIHLHINSMSFSLLKIVRKFLPKSNFGKVKWYEIKEIYGLICICLDSIIKFLQRQWLWIFFVDKLSFAQKGKPLCNILGIRFRICINLFQARVIALQERGIWSSNHPPNGSGKGNVLRHELKSTIVVSILLGCFALSWTPMIIYFFYSISCYECEVNHFVR